MKTAELIQWLANYLYINGGASSKKRAQMSAEEIVVKLIDAGVIITSDATPSGK